jgi:hypothetical protein
MKAEDYGLTGEQKRRRDAEAHHAALDAVQARREEAVLFDKMRGEMAFSRAIAAAPSLIAALQKLKEDDRG